MTAQGSPLRRWANQAAPALAALAFLAGPAGANAVRTGRPSISPDAGVLLGLLAAITIGWPFARPSPAARRRWAPIAVGGAWAAIVSLEIEHQVARYATNENLPMYDAALLSRHLFVLARDLYGGWAVATVAALVVAPFVLWALGVWLAAIVARELARIGGGAAAATAGVLVLAGLAGLAAPGGRFATARIARNAVQSWGLYRDVADEIARRSASQLDALAGLTLPSTPDVYVLVIESYGRVVATHPEMVPEWDDALARVGGVLADAEWTTASAWGAAPVRGGRSWIADASVLLGLRLAHESEYEHVMSIVDRLPSLVRFMGDRGYTTYLVKPSDRERPGVALENPFGFERTVFASDLGYRGPVVGWGRIPDQYTLGWVGEHLAQVPEPVFVWVHLATSHVPWTAAPPLFDDWRQWDATYGPQQPLHADRDLEQDLAMRLSRFKRRDAEDERHATPVQEANYAADVCYDLRAIGAMLAGGPARPTLIVVMGDHQPPLVADAGGYDVPIHVIASDPSLVAPFVARGFISGMRPDGTSPSVLGHQDLFPLLAHALAEAPR